MSVALSEVGRSGRLELTFSLQDGKTILRDAYCEVPFKLTRVHPSDGDGIAHLILMHCTAGLFGGDSTECRILVESGARILITQQSATKVHPSKGLLAVQKIHIRVEAGAELRMVGEPLIPFAASRLHSSTTIDLAPAARLRWWEGFMAGRLGHGEAWQFDELSLETRLRVNERLVYLDRFRLTQGSSPHDFGYVGTGLLFDSEAAGIDAVLHERLPAAGVDIPAPGLVAVRVLATDGPEFQACRAAFLSASA